MKINMPIINENLEEINLKSWRESYEADDLLTYFQVDGEEFIEEAWNHIDATNGRFQHCRIQNSNFKKASFVDVIFDHCDFSNSNFSEAYFSRCQFINCRCVGTDFHESLFKHVLISDCKLSYANLNGVLLEKVNMKDCDLTEAACAESKMKGLDASGCKFVKTNFFHTSLKGFDFSGNELDEIIVSDSLEEVKGCKISVEQSLQAAYLLGMKVV